MTRGLRFINFAVTNKAARVAAISMKENKEAKISYIAAHFTTIVSVTLVLLLVGIIAMVWVGANKETRRLREQIELSVVMGDSVTNARAQNFAAQIQKAPYSLKTRYISKEEALENWTRDTGENLETLFGVNPLSPEVEFTLRSEYTEPDSIKKICEQLKAESGVAEVSTPETRIVESIDRTISRLTGLLGTIAIVMVVISFVLINNTVHLAIYSRRFTIHTMKLVGATNSYIRRPIVMNNLSCGLVAGLLASGILATGLAFAPGVGFHELSNALGWEEFGIIAGGLVLVGMLICAAAAWLSAVKYLRKDYDELFK